MQQHKSSLRNAKRGNLNWKFKNYNLNTHISSWNMDKNPVSKTTKSQIPPGALWEDCWKLLMELWKSKPTNHNHK